MKSYTIHLIRHGVTEGNLKGQYIGRTDSPLAPEGIAELQQLREKYVYPQAQVYYVSPLSRCTQTLHILYPEAQGIVIDNLRECDFGDWEGKTAEQLQKEDPRFLQWMESGVSATPPNGEGGDVFMQRVCLAFEKIVEGMMRSGTTSAVIVTHGGVIMSILSAYGLPRAKFYDWLTENGCGYTLRITAGLWMRSMVAEVAAQLPQGRQEKREYSILNLAREAADKAFGEEKEDKDLTNL